MKMDCGRNKFQLRTKFFSSTDDFWSHWGTGCLQLRQILTHLRDMKWKGYLAIEYEANWLNSVPDIRKSLQYFDTLSEEVLK